MKHFVITKKITKQLLENVLKKLFNYQKHQKFIDMSKMNDYENIICSRYIEKITFLHAMVVYTQNIFKIWNNVCVKEVLNIHVQLGHNSMY